jgi:DHA1 family bicyclomycin/chloramphenicol resistance-like MFS transporter
VPLIAPKSVFFTVLLASFAGLPALATDMSLPGLGAMVLDLGTAPAQGALSLSVFLAGFGVAQLAFGPLSDRYGRRRLLLVGLVMFTLGGLLCAVADDIAMLLVARLVQGAGAAAGTVLAVAMVRDCFEGPAAHARLSYVSATMSLAPIVAPIVGAGLLQIGSWRLVFDVLCASGVVLWLVVALATPETIRQRNPDAIRLAGLLGSYRRAVSHRSAFAHTLIGAAQFANMFAFISGSPLVYIQQMGLHGGAYALVFAAASGGLTIGSLGLGKLSRKPWARHALPVGLVVSTLASLALLALSLSGGFSLWRSVPLLVLDYIACGVVMPSAAHGGVEPFPDMAGVASALNGAIRMLGGVISGVLVALLYDATPLAMCLSMAAFATLALAVWLVRLGQARAVAA